MQLRKRKKSRLLQTCKEKKNQKNQLSILLIRHTQKNTTTTTTILPKIQSFVAIPVPKLEQRLYLAASTLMKLFGSP
jgi:hypothetical protein